MDVWLREELTQNFGLDAEDEVFHPYILGVIDGDEDESEKSEAIEGILSGLTSDEDLIKDFCAKVAKKVKELASASGSAEAAKAEDKSVMDLSERLRDITATNSAAFEAARANRTDTGPDGAVKAAILAQYAGVEESDDDDDGGDDDTERNLNAEKIANAEAERKEALRTAAMAKKAKDKEDREKQKQQADDRKKKAQEKTQKGERRR